MGGEGASLGYQEYIQGVTCCNESTSAGEGEGSSGSVE